MDPSTSSVFSASRSRSCTRSVSTAIDQAPSSSSRSRSPSRAAAAAAAAARVPVPHLNTTVTTPSLGAFGLSTPTPSSTGDERSPLLLHRVKSSSSGIQNVRKLSAAVSDYISGGAHSGAGAAGHPQALSLHFNDALSPNADPEGEQYDECASLFSDQEHWGRGDEAEEGISWRGGRRRKSGKGTPSLKGYDGEFRHDLQGEAGNGIRQWYDNFHTIDWIHDSIKHSYRMRKLRLRKRTDGLRGQLVNLWDGSQGWILVTVIGILTALVAFMITSSEMLLFDLKDGYCATNPRLAKRFCCPVARRGRTGSIFSLMSVVKAPQVKEVEDHCANWRTWAQVWVDKGGSEHYAEAIAYLAFICIAVLFAVFAATLTIYLTASDSVYSSKDSPSIPHPGFSPAFPALLSSRPGLSPSPSVSFRPEDSLRADDGKLQLPTPRPRKVMYFAAGSGIPEIKTILSGMVIRGYLGTWTLVTKAVGLSFSVASGLSLGKEGPLVHISSAVGNIASRFFPKYDRNEGKRREILSAACAAGVSVSFGAPVGGTLFSLEEVSYFFPSRTMIRSFWCAMIAAISLKMLDPFGTGKTVLFEVTYDRDWHTFELIGFLLLGAFGGIYGALFCKTNIWWTRRVRNGTFLRSHPIIEVALVTLITVAIAFYNPWTKMGGTEFISELFSECHIDSTNKSALCVDVPGEAWALIGSVAFALVAKAALTVITFGIKLPAGIFIPTLVVGACTGRIAGLLVEVLHAHNPTWTVFAACRTSNEQGPLPFGQACVLPGVWSMIGAVSALAGVTRTTVSLAVICFELTSTLAYTVPVMLGVVVAKTVGDAIEPRSIYDLVIELNDLPYLDAKLEYIHESTPGDILASDTPVISLDEDNTFGSLRSKLASLYEQGVGGGFPIVASEEGGGQRMYGYLASKELEFGLVRSSLTFSSPTTPCTFRVASASRQGISLQASRVATPAGCDFSWLVDMAPITVSLRSPMELVHELFVKLGVRYVVVVDDKGLYKGVIEKNHYLSYLQWLEKKAVRK
ncbi:BZ3500_MvSof-1268-A1-R1_Chr1-3g01854 [Microbotryum saponariae]|uniref:Chloride channel protein n=1 Tax=Microbotryum saponariae TaxID=289078 RepID=A0A2X0LFG5_9BASI|nr:BZ3500_MvSof-1268-A1-R1_Chr1-3g01854 [Microbotryum saponariae]SCZ94743.1 BZ3501_MvSof-1269-A2-R1_Chr1-3g01456 [Microbotryum saponariae]